MRFLIVLIFAFTVFAAAAPADDTVTLEQAVELALRQNRTLETSALDVQRAGDRIAAARTNRLPRFHWTALAAQRLTDLDFRFERGAFGVYPGIGPVPGADTSIHSSLRPVAFLWGRIDQPLSQQYRIGLALEQLRLARQAAVERERAQKHAIVSEVKRTYYSILQAQSALESVEESIRLYKELDRITDRYVIEQVALKSDSLEVKLRLAKAEYEALALRNPLATQKEQLNRLLGRDISTEFRASPVLEASWIEIDIAGARAAALERRPEIAEARLKLRQAEIDRRLKKAEYIPDLSLSFNYLSPMNFGGIIPAHIATAGLLLDWEPFDWGRKKRELAEKSRTIEQAQLGLQEAEAMVAIEVNGRFRKLEEARKLLQVARLGQEMAREKLRVGKNRYTQEAALLKDVLQLQAAMAEANSQYQQALLAFWTARTEFEKAIGEAQ